MGRKFAVALVAVGMVIGFKAAQFVPESVVNAQTGWQCSRQVLTEKDDLSGVATWLGQARSVEISTAGLTVAGRYVLVACKQ
jgi:hypothetical protein